MVDIIIDSLTDCITKRDTGIQYDTLFEKVTRTITKAEAKNDISHGWKFDWYSISVDERNFDIYELYLKENQRLQGRIALRICKGYVEVGWAENHPKNIGSSGEFEGVGGNLFAIACLISKKAGCGGYVAFESKTDKKVMANYSNPEYIGAKRIGDSNRFYIDEENAERLIKKYRLEE